jgi:hypothetical protein
MIVTCSTWKEGGEEGRFSDEGGRGQGRGKTTHIIDFIPRDIVAIENEPSGGDDFEIKIVEQHFVGHDGIVWIHPDDGSFHWPGDVIHLNQMRDMLVSKDLCLHHMKGENRFDSWIWQDIGKRDSTKALQGK